MKSDYTVHKNYQRDEALRRSLNALAGEVFKISFEDWYQKGYWGEGCIPYSIVHEDRIIANAFANLMEFQYFTEIRRYLQIGTVMTHKSYRGQGLSRLLIGQILQEYAGRADGIYLFANRNVLDFYPKFGFTRRKEYRYLKKTACSGPMTAILAGDPDAPALAVDKNNKNSALEMINNPGLMMFHLMDSMKDSLYYIESCHAFVSAEVRRGRLKLYQIFSEDPVDMDEVIKAFGAEVKEVWLGFRPLGAQGYEVVELQEQDTVLFTRGEGFHDFEREKMVFPALSHA